MLTLAYVCFCVALLVAAFAPRTPPQAVEEKTPDNIGKLYEPELIAVTRQGFIVIRPDDPYLIGKRYCDEKTAAYIKELEGKAKIAFDVDNYKYRVITPSSEEIFHLNLPPQSESLIVEDQDGKGVVIVRTRLSPNDRKMPIEHKFKPIPMKGDSK